jgi:hypothetical protein
MGLPACDLALASKRDLDEKDEIYSVRRRKDTPVSENLGFPNVDSGLRRARS